MSTVLYNVGALFSYVQERRDDPREKACATLSSFCSSPFHGPGLNTQWRWVCSSVRLSTSSKARCRRISNVSTAGWARVMVLQPPFAAVRMERVTARQVEQR
eukprot:TRINITY_DN4060_c0_g1_i1.p3 TRINITY_DN4060_c0_g1~~TRINITY_DN4060_c0_g1_i1.p3  ORF type:complete len:102 (-),score=1.30 TRINITY_DN4060_c0_g1_i1:477-782(-)